MTTVVIWTDPPTFAAVSDLLDVVASLLRVEHILGLHPARCTCTCGFMAVACDLVAPSAGLTVYLIEQALAD